MRTKTRKNTHINEHSSQHQDHTIQYKLCDLPSCYGLLRNQVEQHTCR